MKRSYRFLSLVACVLLCALLAACNGDEGATTSSDPNPPGGSPASGTENGTLTVSMPGDIDNFDPYTNQLIQYEWAIRNTVFDTLVKYDENLEIVAGVATPEASEDAKTFTFELREGVAFSDGTPLNAHAAIRSLKAAARSKGIYAARLADVASYEATDERTLVITLNKPDAAFLDGLAKIALVAPDHLKTAGKRPVGSGPFTFESWTPNDRIVLQRNEDYWGEKPPYETLELRPIADEQLALNDLYAGDLDVIGSASTDLLAQLDEARAQAVEPSASNSIALVEMMGKTGKLDDPRLRQAMAHAFDRESIRKVAYGGRGESEWSPLPTGSWAYAEQEGYPYDVERARELVNQAGADGTTVTLELLAGNPEATKMARVWQQSLVDAGIELEIRTSELSVWLDRYTSHNYDAIWNFFNVSGDPHSFFDVIMKPHLGDRYDKPEMTKLIAEGISTTDQDARAEVYGELQEIMVEDLPVLTVQSRPLAAVVAAGVEGVQINPLGWPLLAGAQPAT